MSSRSTRSELEFPILNCKFLILSFVVALSAALAAHHSFSAEFDAKKPIRLSGVVTKVDWVSPHGWIYIDVKGPDGTIVNWAIQTAAPESLVRRGWRKDSVVPGTTITIDAFEAKNRKATANGRDVTLPDGRQLCANIPCRCCSSLSGFERQ